MSQPVAWPKGPFPERYRADAVWQRLEAATASVLARATEACGASRAPLYDDPYVCVIASELGLSELRSRIAGVPVFAFRWIPGKGTGAADPGNTFGLVASRDPIDAVVANGVAGPAEGIGTPTLVRFLAHLRSFADYDPTLLSEDRIEMRITPKSDELGRRIAERVVQITPSLARHGLGGAELAERMRVHQALEMFWRS